MSAETAISTPSHAHLPDERQSITHKFTVGNFKGCFTIGLYPDGNPGELFIKADKEGSTLKGMLNAFAIAVSLGLQHGIPIDKFAQKFKYMRFEPEGTVGQDACSIVDYIFKWIEKKFKNVSETKESHQTEGRDSHSESGNGNGSSKRKSSVSSGSSTNQLQVSYAALAKSG